MEIIAGIGKTSAFYRVAAVMWLSFLMAGVATGAFFSAIDPLQLKPCVDFPEVSRTAAYSIGFFLFWLLTLSSSLMSVFFLYPTREDSPSSKTNESS